MNAIPELVTYSREIMDSGSPEFVQHVLVHVWTQGTAQQCEEFTANAIASGNIIREDDGIEAAVAAAVKEIIEEWRKVQ